jgi:hypothetical protein
LYLKAPPSTEDSFIHQLEVRHPFQLITWRPSAILIKNFLCFTLRKACWDLKGFPWFAGLDPWASALEAIS